MQTYPSAISDATLTVSNAAYIQACDVSAVLTFSVESVCAVSSSAVYPVEGSSVDGLSVVSSTTGFWFVSPAHSMLKL